MPQSAWRLLQALLPLQILSGAVTRRESQPELVQLNHVRAPTTTKLFQHGQGTSFRGACIAVMWRRIAALRCRRGVLLTVAGALPQGACHDGLSTGFPKGGGIDQAIH